MLVVDGDGHVVEPEDLWVSRMDAKKWGDWVPHPGTDEYGYPAFFVGGEIRAGGKEAVDLILRTTGATQEDLLAQNAKLQYEGGHDPHARIRDMDAAGIDVAVLYPSSAMFYGPLDPISALGNPEFVRDCQRAYNEWLADYCSAYPDRLFGVGGVPLQDVELATAEVARIAEMGMKAIFLRPAPYVDELPFSHPVYDPFWAACQEAGLPVAFHPGVGVDMPDAVRLMRMARIDKNLGVVNMAVDPVHGGSGFGQAIGNACNMINTMGRLLMGGVCERFPSLRFIFLECAGGWAPTMLERMDEQVESFPLEGRWLSMLPSEYFRRQCTMSFEPEEWNLAACARWLGADRVIWASDYPHPEYEEDVVDEVKRRVAELEPAEQERILGLNAVEVYDLPVGAGASA